MLFQFMFCAVSLAIVWGTTLERIKFGVYIIYAVVFAGVIYPIGAHWVFGGGWLPRHDRRRHAGLRRLDRGAPRSARPARWRCCCCSARARASTAPTASPRAIPGHSMPLFGLGVLILWLGWFGFNAGSTLGALGRPLRRDRARHEARRRPAACSARSLVARLKTEHARHRHGRQRRDRRARRDHRPVGLRRAVGGADHRPRRRRASSRSACYAIDKKLDDPVGALTAHGMCGVWGTLACGLFTSPRLAEYNGVRRRRPVLLGLVRAARRAGARRRAWRSRSCSRCRTSRSW